MSEHIKDCMCHDCLPGTHPAPGKADREWPPRCWVTRIEISTGKQFLHAYGSYEAASKNEAYAEIIPMVSLAEHQAILAQAELRGRIAELYEIFELSPSLSLSMRIDALEKRLAKATAERGAAPKGGV